MPLPYDATNLKSRFQTGDKPTQQDYADWIDTMFYHLSDLGTRMAVVEAAMTALQANNGIAKVFATIQIQSAPSLLDDFGVATVTSINQVGANGDPDTLRTVRITFDTAFADANYTFVVRSSLGQIPVLAGKTTTRLDLQVNETAVLSVVVFNV